MRRRRCASGARATTKKASKATANRRRRGSTETKTSRQGDKATRRQGDKATRRQGERATRRRSNDTEFCRLAATRVVPRLCEKGGRRELNPHDPRSQRGALPVELRPQRARQELNLSLGSCSPAPDRSATCSAEDV